jgi:RNAse (barnase) inhibitor barstar
MSKDRVEIDLESVQTPLELHNLLAQRLAFPDFYGRNWDAFWDCVRSPEMSAMPRVLVLSGWGKFESKLPREARIMREALVDLMQARPECMVEWA